MPATITHAYFAQDVYDILPLDIKNKINLNRFRMFGQSTDPLMFYNIMNLKRGKKIRKLQYTFHTVKPNEYFINLINYIKNNELYNDIDTCSFLYGFICHYILDSTVHPFIIYKTGRFNKRKKETYKYNNIHSFMETFIDNDMVKRREKVNPYRFHFSKFCFDLRKFSNELNSAINYSFSVTYDVDNISNIYYTSLKQMKTFLNLFRRDPYGFKKNLYKLIDTFTTNKVFRFEALSYHYPLNDKHNFLNSNKSIWRNPIYYNLVSHESFIELYLKSIKIAKDLIIMIDKYIYGDDLDLNKIIPDVSYLSGVKWNIDKEMKYFEF